MATLQKIRNHGVLLLVIVGAAMLAFILGDFLNSGSSFFHRGREYVGSIEGEDIHYTEYEAARDQLTEVYKIEYGRSDFDEDMSAQIRNQVWQMMLMDYTLSAQARKIGMNITDEELSNLCIGDNPHQIIRGRRAFAGEDGQFSRENLIRFYNQVFLNDDAENQGDLRQAKSYWLYWEKAVRLTHLQEKYTALLQHLVGPNSLDAEFAFQARQTSANVQYAMQPYHAVADSLVKVSNSDIKKLYNARKDMYKQKPNRAISYVAFPIVPSEQDFAETEKIVRGLEEEFRTTDDIALVVNVNSDRMYDARDYSESSIPEQYKEFAFGKDAKAGNCTELSFVDNTYSIARIMECGYSLPDSVELKAIAAQEGQEDTELGWIAAEQLPKNIAEKALRGKRGERFTVTQGMGEATFEILDIAPATPKAKVAILERKVTPSSRTYSTLYNQAKQFIVANPGEEAFLDAAHEAGMTVTPQYNLEASTDKVGQLKSSRAIVRWAFEAKEGQVSDVFECGDQFVVATLTEVNEGEYRSMEAVRSELTQLALNHKKYELVKRNLAGAESLEQAAEIMGAKVQNADNVTLGSYRFGNQGAEPAVIGVALAQAENVLSEPVEGVAGVYMLKTLAKNTAEAEFNVENEKQQLAGRNYSLVYQAINLIQERADIQDNRFNFQ